jgi:hypothetical protein
MNSWELVKQFLSQQINVSPKLIEYIAVYDILKLCAEGRSNLLIANRTGLDIPYIQSVLNEFFLFAGFKDDLEFNSRYLYLRNRFNWYSYLQTARCWDSTSSTEDIRQSYSINKIFDAIEREVESYYEPTRL